MPRALQGYLTSKKPPPPRTLQKDQAWGPTGVLGGWAFSYERSTPVDTKPSTLHTADCKGFARPAASCVEGYNPV